MRLIIFPRSPKLVHQVDVEAGLTRYKAIPTILYMVYNTKKKIELKITAKPQTPYPQVISSLPVQLRLRQRS